MIQIKCQSGTNQYDEEGNAITYWDDKKCAWIVLPEYEQESINWYGKNSDFPAGCTLKEYEKTHPNWKSIPNIAVTWFWNTKETAQKTFGQPHTFGESFDYWDRQQYPYTCHRDWGYIECTKENAVKEFATYCGFQNYADRVIVTYNGETILDGKYESVH